MAKNTTSFTSETAPRNGRPPGAKNKMTQQVLDSFLYILHLYNSPERLKDDLDKMSPANRRRTLEGITKYVVPALSKNDNTNTVNGGVKIVIDWGGDIEPTQSLLTEDSPAQIDAPFMPINLADNTPDWMKNDAENGVE